MEKQPSSALDSIEKLLENIPDNVKSMLEGIAQDEFPKKSTNNPQQAKNLEMIVKIKGIFDKVDNVRDERMNLILAMSPFLRPSRQEKATKFMKALRVSRLFQEALTFMRSEMEKEDISK